MSDFRQQRSRALMLSKRACVFYLERVRVMLKDDRIVYLTDNLQPMEHFYNIPEKNTAFLLLGKGSSFNRCCRPSFGRILMLWLDFVVQAVLLSFHHLISLSSHHKVNIAQPNICKRG